MLNGADQRGGRFARADLGGDGLHTIASRSPRAAQSDTANVQNASQVGRRGLGIDLAPNSFVDSPTVDVNGRVIEGWIALEQRNLDGARAALREVYEVNPSHPALPLLAAGIRRVRGPRVRWRPLVLSFVLIIVAALGMRAWMVARSAPRTATVTAVDTTPAAPEPSPAAPARPMQSSSARTGTSGDAAPTAPPPREPATRTPGDAPSPLSDEAQIRDMITRFATVYAHHWTRLALFPCTIAPVGDSAIVTCQARATKPDRGADAGGLWMFSCRRVEGVWKIVSVQPPDEGS